jgi:hypothetical protein
MRRRTPDQHSVAVQAGVCRRISHLVYQGGTSTACNDRKLTSLLSSALSIAFEVISPF